MYICCAVSAAGEFHTALLGEKEENDLKEHSFRDLSDCHKCDELSGASNSLYSRPCRPAQMKHNTNETDLFIHKICL